MKKRIAAMLLAVIMLMSILAACGGNTAAPAPTTQAQVSGEAENTPAPAPAEVTYDGSPVTIKFYHTMGANLRAVLEAYIAEFNALYPNITIEHSQVGNYDDVREQISTEISVGNQPHIAYCYPDHVALYNIAKATQPLDKYIDSTAEVTRADGTTEILGLTAEQKADFIAGYYNEGKAFGDGLMYTMPMSKSTEVLYYNKTFFEANNLTVPTTWDELEAVCAEIKKIDPQSIPLGYDSEANWFITMTEQYGSPYTSAEGDHYLFDNEQNHAFVKKFNEWFNKAPTPPACLFPPAKLRATCPSAPPQVLPTSVPAPTPTAPTPSKWASLPFLRLTLPTPRSSPRVPASASLQRKMSRKSSLPGCLSSS